MPRSANPTTPKRRSKTKSRKNEIGSDSESVSEFEFTLNGKLIPKGTLNIYKVSQLADALHTSSPAKRLKVPSSPKLVRTESGPLQAAIDNLQIQVQGPSTTKKQNEESKENLERSIESEAELEEDEEIVKLVKFLLDAKKGK